MTQSLNNSNKDGKKIVFVKYLYPSLRMRKTMAPTRLVKYWHFCVFYANMYCEADIKNVNLCELEDERQSCFRKSTNNFIKAIFVTGDLI